MSEKQQEGTRVLGQIKSILDSTDETQRFFNLIANAIAKSRIEEQTGQTLAQIMQTAMPVEARRPIGDFIDKVDPNKKAALLGISIDLSKVNMPEAEMAEA